MSGMTVGSTEQLMEKVKSQVIQWRRYLHQYPELSYQEEQTAQFVYETLRSFGNLELSRPTPTSVVARLVGGKFGKVLAIRADMDALPIREENSFDFVSKNPGVMHACGHDGHTSMLLGAARVLSQMKEKIGGEVRFIFQHAEELPPGGGEELVRAGVMEGVDAVIGAHLWSPLAIGKVGIVYGPMMASPDIFKIIIHGKGGHAALPHQTVDSIAVGAQVVTNLQHIASRCTDPLEPLVLSVTRFVGGNSHNVLPGSVEIEGTVRTLDTGLRERVPGQIERVVKGITEAHGASYELEYKYGYRPVINDREITRLMEKSVQELFGEEAVAHLKPTMGGEDFSAYQQKAPGNFFFIGAGNPEKNSTYSHHHPRFTIDEDALEIGVRLFVHSALKMCS